MVTPEQALIEKRDLLNNGSSPFEYFVKPAIDLFTESWFDNYGMAVIDNVIHTGHFNADHLDLKPTFMKSGSRTANERIKLEQDEPVLVRKRRKTTSAA